MKLSERAGHLMSKYAIFVVLILMIVISSILNKNFLRPQNLIIVAVQLTVPTILACGAMLLVISGLLDLSCGAVMALSGVLSVSFYKANGSLLLAVVLAIVIAVVCNLVNALFVASFRMPSFIVTLAMTMVARGLAQIYTSGQNILQIGDYSQLGQGKLGGVVPIPLVFLVIIGVASWYILNQTRFGRSLYAIGGNEEAAVASGINVIRAKYTAFIINGILVGLAAAIYTARVNAGLPNGAEGYEMEGLTATIVGGTSFSGGVGSVSGTIIGSFIIGFLNNIMNLTGVDSYVQQVVKGAIIVAAVLYDIRFKNKKAPRVIVQPTSHDNQKPAA